jgi:hypothetical protein
LAYEFLQSAIVGCGRGIRKWHFWRDSRQLPGEGIQIIDAEHYALSRFLPPATQNYVRNLFDDEISAFEGELLPNFGNLIGQKIFRGKPASRSAFLQK